MTIWRWLSKPLHPKPCEMELLLKIEEQKQEILNLEKEVIHWKRIALEFKRHH